MTNNLSPSMQQQAEKRIDPMELLFGQLHGMYGKAFTDKYGSGATVNGKDSGIENTKLVWHEKIRANRLRMPDIKRGLASCGKFVPTFPEFLEFCRPTPNADAALIEAVQQLHARNEGKDHWSHPAIYWAAQKVGYHEMTTLSTSALKPRFSAALDDVMQQEVIKPVPEIVQGPRLAAPPTVSAEDIATAKAMISTFTNEQTKANGAPVDGLRWAKRVIARVQSGDKTVSLHQLREAEQALKAGSCVID